jgi:hypothetical protein
MTTTTYTFPHTALTPIVGKPTLATLTLLKLELYTNAMFTESLLGGGNHGYLALVMYQRSFPGLRTWQQSYVPKILNGSTTINDCISNHSVNSTKYVKSCKILLNH